jgi:hypothetical protein
MHTNEIIPTGKTKWRRFHGIDEYSVTSVLIIFKSIRINVENIICTCRDSTPNFRTIIDIKISQDLGENVSSGLSV